MDSSVYTPTLIKYKSFSKKYSGRPLLSMNNRDSGESMSLGILAGGSPSVYCTPPVEVTSPMINQSRGIRQETLQGSPSLRYVEQQEF